MPFSASYDRTTKILSGIVCFGLLAIVFAIHSFIVDVLTLLVLLAALAYSPRGYVVEGQSILVRRLAGTVRIALNGVREVRKTTAEDWRGCIRLWGSGGLFGYYGLFSTAKLGKSTWYVTNRSHAVVVITDAKTVLFSPDDPDSFLSAIRAVVPQIITEVAYEDGARTPVPSRRSSRLGTIVATGVALAALGLAAAAIAYSPGPPSYTLTPESLTIHDRFYPVTLRASDVDVNEIQIVDLSQDIAWRPIQRTNGFANWHYQAGWFEVAGGRKVRLYRADSARVVLLPSKGDGTPVLYQAADPEKFVGEIRTQWSASTRNSSNAGKWIYYAL
jgi:hypothetical protein